MRVPNSHFPTPKSLLTWEHPTNNNPYWQRDEGEMESRDKMAYFDVCRWFLAGVLEINRERDEVSWCVWASRSPFPAFFSCFPYLYRPFSHRYFVSWLHLTKFGRGKFSWERDGEGANIINWQVRGTRQIPLEENRTWIQTVVEMKMRRWRKKWRATHMHHSLANSQDTNSGSSLIVLQDTGGKKMKMERSSFLRVRQNREED